VRVEELKEIKKKSGLTDSRIAEMTGYNRSYVNQVFNGVVPMSPAFYSRLSRVIPMVPVDDGGGDRSATVRRKTGETDISLELNIDGTGKYEVDAGIFMLDHLLSQVARHGRFDLKGAATGDDPHHLAEDIAICLGKAFLDALGEKRGIVRMADATVPMDDALATVAVDLSGRAYSVLELGFNDNDMSGFSTDLIRHFLESFAIEARMSLHARIIYGTNDHHRAEALFKALGRALDMATAIDRRIAGESPSTKGMLEKGA
jgi:imidazoleglycerol-phosphate dehydratase